MSLGQAPSVCNMPLFSVVVDTVFTYINNHKTSRFHFSLANVLMSCSYLTQRKLLVQLRPFFNRIPQNVIIKFIMIWGNGDHKKFFVGEKTLSAEFLALLLINVLKVVAHFSSLLCHTQTAKFLRDVENKHYRKEKVINVPTCVLSLLFLKRPKRKKTFPDRSRNFFKTDKLWRRLWLLFDFSRLSFFSSKNQEKKTRRKNNPNQTKSQPKVFLRK